MEYKLAGPQTDIINNLIETGIIPEDSKSENVTAIHKKESMLEPENYRPITLTSSLKDHGNLED